MLFTYPLTLGAALAADIEGQVVFERDGSYSIEIYDLNSGDYRPAVIVTGADPIADMIEKRIRNWLESDKHAELNEEYFATLTGREVYDREMAV